jgi:hypothetical protein
VYSLNVSDLMVPNMKLWDTNKIESLFPLHIAKRIVETPLPSVVEEDKLIWGDNRDGNYSVRSGYKVMVEVQRQATVMSQNSDWLRLWKIRAPPKAKHLLWRICRDCLPTRARLQEKHVPCQLSCPICEQHEEDEWHAIFTCSSSVEARHTAGLDSFLSNRIQHARNIRELILDVCVNESVDDAGRFAMLAWVLWQNRNNKLWNATQETGRNLGSKRVIYGMHGTMCSR